jgi:hypothetical protein
MTQVTTDKDAVPASGGLQSSVLGWSTHDQIVPNKLSARGPPDRNLSQEAAVFLAEAPEATSPLVKGLVPGSGISLPHGQPRARKSFVVLDTQIAASTGCPPFGLARLEVVEPIVCWYLTEEDCAGEVKKRVRALLAGRGLTEPPSGFRLSVQRGLSLDDVETQDHIIREILKYRVRLVGIDPIRGSSGAVDKGPGDLQPLVKCLRRITRETGVELRIDGKPDDRARAHRASALCSSRLSGDPCRRSVSDPCRRSVV